MTRTVRSLIVVALILLALFAGCVVASVRAAAPCALFSITPINAFANIRSSADATKDNITGRLNKGESIRAASAVNGWYSVATGGFVSASVVTATCAATQVAATVTLIPLPTVTATATLAPTPTRVTGTQATPGVWVVMNGVGQFCELPCQIEVRSNP